MAQGRQELTGLRLALLPCGSGFPRLRAYTVERDNQRQQAMSTLQMMIALRLRRWSPGCKQKMLRNENGAAGRRSSSVVGAARVRARAPVLPHSAVRRIGNSNNERQVARTEPTKGRSQPAVGTAGPVPNRRFRTSAALGRHWDRPAFPPLRTPSSPPKNKAGRAKSDSRGLLERITGAALCIGRTRRLAARSRKQFPTPTSPPGATPAAWRMPSACYLIVYKDVCAAIGSATPPRASLRRAEPPAPALLSKNHARAALRRLAGAVYALSCALLHN